MRILHIITSLDAGGGQWVLFELAKQLNKLGYKQCVISMKPNGSLAEKIIKENIELHELNFSFKSLSTSIKECHKFINSFQPDCIQSWLYHGDFLTILLRPKIKIPIYWGLHHSYESRKNNRLKLSTRIIVFFNKVFSKTVPRKIICCSKSALNSHIKYGYDLDKMIFIPNGINIDRFRPDPAASKKIKKELNIQSRKKIIGYIARFHPQKDHENFFAAAKQLLQIRDNVEFILAGSQITHENFELSRLLTDQQLSDHVHLLGQRDDISLITAALDIATLASSGDEALPLTMIEAMACGVICVATDVGDVKEVVGNAGFIVPAHNSQALADQWQQALELSTEQRNGLVEIGINRVKQSYTNIIMAKNYLDVYLTNKDN